MQALKVVVTGAVGALGMAICEEFIQTGALVAGLDLKPSSRFEEKFGKQAFLATGPLGNAQEIKQTMASIVEKLGGLHVVCNIAGGFNMGPFEEFDPQDMDRMLEMNYRSAYHATWAAVPFLKQAKGGKIIFIGARPAVSAGPQMVAYAASKAAVLSMSRSLAAELLPDSIQVNAVLPSIMDTPANRAAMPDANFDKWPKPEQIAKIIRWLCSDEANLISGAEIPVYGLS